MPLIPPSGGVAGRFLRNEHILLNVVILSTYFWFRNSHIDDHVDISVPIPGRGKVTKGSTLLHSAPFGQMEAQVAASLVLTVIMRSYKATSPDALLATILGHCQLFVLINAVLSDWIAGAWYLLAFGLVFLLFNEPSYKAASKVEVLTAELFQDLCLKEDKSGVAYVVFLETKWSSRCRHAYPIFAELSLRYATDKLHFARLDVGSWPRLARTLNLDLSATSSQLPTVILFEGGQEVARVPGASRAALSGAGKHTFSKVQLVSALQLDSRFAKSMGSTPATAASGGTST